MAQFLDLLGYLFSVFKVSKQPCQLRCIVRQCWLIS